MTNGKSAKTESLLDITKRYTLSKSIDLHLSDRQEIYLISDIHSNFPALASIINEIPDDSIIICAGDVVGYYLDCNEVCNLLKERRVHCIKGNHDKYVLGEMQCSLERRKLYRVDETQEDLIQENTDWLRALPSKLHLRFYNQNNAVRTMSVYHGSPDNCESYIYPNSDLSALTSEESDFVILGHTHHPMKRTKKDTLVINPGSVGQPRDRKPGACYARMLPFNRSVYYERARYDIDRYQAKLGEYGIDQSIIDFLSRT